MELLLTAAAFTIWQCLAWLPRETFAFVPWPRRRQPVPGGGVRVLHPWPGASGLLATALPFRVCADAVRFEGSLGRMGSGGVPDPPRDLPFEELGDVTVRSTTLLRDGRRLLRCGSPRHAAWTRTRLRELADTAPGDREALLGRWMEVSLDPEAARTAWQRARSATRGLAWTCDGSLLLLFAVTPALLLIVSDTERVLSAVALPFVLLHLLGAFGLWRAHAALRPERRGERGERVFAATLFPPALWRTPQELVADALLGIHPVAVAAVALEDEALELFLRHALAAACLRQERADTSAESRLADQERAGILAIARTHELPIEQARQRSDARGERYCPLCHEDFRPGFETCSDCRIPTVAYREAAAVAR